MPHVISEGNIWTVPNCLSREECTRWIEDTERIGFAPAAISTEAGPQMMPELRNNERLILDDPRLAAMVWQRLAGQVPEFIGECRATGLNERFRFYRYRPGQRFNWHYDGSYQRSATERSRLSLLVYLSEGCEGGETEFADFRVEPQQGMALLFRHELLHCGAPVRSGCKYVMRSDVMYEQEFVSIQPPSLGR